MSFVEERRCAGCADTEEMAPLDRCVVCGKYFCPDCAYRAMGRRFCAQACSVQFYYGDTDDEDNLPADD
jgi:hypothetical protein